MGLLPTRVLSLLVILVTNANGCEDWCNTVRYLARRRRRLSLSLYLRMNEDERRLPYY